ncbi:MAG: NAD(P)/FAD-dependent oxidoreductase [Trueperaceae bacterium]|nr:NAD(P)/FAD-dependent oxidoreductase [Trueperaceae bacterium]
MTNRHYQVLIIGGGTAGITVAARLRNADKNLDIAVVEPSSKHYYQPLWTLVGAGIVKKEITERQEERYIPKGVHWVKNYVTSLEPDQNSVTLADKTHISYDYLVMAPGIQLDWDRVKGLKDTIGKNGVCSNYAYNEVDYTWETLRNFSGGTAIFTNPAGQVKCGGAPQKIMYLVEDHVRKNGLRDKTEIVGAFAGSVMLGVPEINRTLENIVRERDIHMKFHHNLCAIDGEKKEATFEVLEDGKKRLETLHFDMIHVTPPQSAPDFVKASPLALQEGPNAGFIKVDEHTLQHPDYKNVFALGDAAALPTAKTGAAVRKQAPVLVKNLLHLMHQEALTEQYNGYSSCPLVTAKGKLVLAEFVYGNQYKPTFPIDQTKERLDMYLLKRFVLPIMYWYGMLRGRA